MNKRWPLNTAKTQLSTVIEQAQVEPQIVTKHGKNSAVILSIETFEQLSSKKTALDCIFFCLWAVICN